jgi:hypothetical protein
MNGKIYLIADAYIIIDSDAGQKYVVRKEDSNLPYVIGSDVEYSIDPNQFAIINKCQTIAEIHNINTGWICPRCNRVNAPFFTNCDC